MPRSPHDTGIPALRARAAAARAAIASPNKYIIVVCGQIENLAGNPFDRGAVVLCRRTRPGRVVHAAVRCVGDSAGEGVLQERGSLCVLAAFVFPKSDPIGKAVFQHAWVCLCIYWGCDFPASGHSCARGVDLSELYSKCI